MTVDDGRYSMAKSYSRRLKEQLGSYKKSAHRDVPDGTWRTRKGEDKPYPYILDKGCYEANILPTIKEAFWLWFAEQRLKRHKYFHHLNSSQAMAFNLFFPLLRNGEDVDERLLKALGVAADREYRAKFEEVLDPEEGTNFDFYLYEPGGTEVGRRFFFELKLSESKFGSCRNDERHACKLRKFYAPNLDGHVDAKWLEPSTFCANYQVMRNLSYLGRYEDSGAVFIFPKANEPLMKAAGTIKYIASHSLAPRVAILYLEYLVERILEAVAGDEVLTKHYLALRVKYICV